MVHLIKLFDTLNISKQIKKLKEKNFYNLFYKSLSRSLEKMGLFIFQKKELDKLNMVSNDKKELLIIF